MDFDDDHVLDELAGSLTDDERNLLDDLEGTMRINAAPLTRVRVDGEDTTVSAPHLGPGAEAKLEELARRQYREMGPPA